MEADAVPAPAAAAVVQAPFRLARITLFGGLAAGAGLGLLIIIGRLVQSIKGGPGAPPLEVCLRNVDSKWWGTAYLQRMPRTIVEDLNIGFL
jgi:hypothetical protein